MKHPLKNTLAVAMLALATQAMAQVTLFENENFRGRSFTTERQIGNFNRAGFNDRASSVQVVGGRWEVCEDVRFRGALYRLAPGSIPFAVCDGPERPPLVGAGSRSQHARV